MNKHERRLKGFYKWKKRLRNYRLSAKATLTPDSNKNYYALKSSGKPCSCHLCSGSKYSRKNKHKINLKNKANEHV